MENIAAHWVHPCSRDEVGEVNETTRDVGLFVFLLPTCCVVCSSSSLK
jgi:hypothetical protein